MTFIPNKNDSNITGKRLIENVKHSLILMKQVKDLHADVTSVDKEAVRGL